MRKLVWVALLSLGVLQATGCFFSSGDDGDGAGVFDVTWSLDPDCPAGATTAQVLSQEVDANGNAIGSPIEDLFLCDDGGGTTALLPLGDYDVSVNITDDSTNVLFAQSDIVQTAINSDGDTVPVSFDILTEEAFFFLTWSIDGAAADSASCNAAGAGGGVSVLSTLAGTTAAADDIFGCADGEGETDPLPLGDYVISVSLLDDADLAIDVIDPPLEESLEVGNESFDLGDFDFVP